ncbi:nucleoporin p54-like [Xyrauchen texanus]|uniref:nucleoporin p54-like n=1 Tax=Xyrauchen texanus TaxID=154827 RepID=UPI00224254C3|nr:nucleoporin p54-like [Xyrauchen texanus]XP_051962003.1 nucleoporin p54-like [Xyrauchen texanus]XP_051962004.1 nucleoporin p54-like [Xyrauchen texanus]XP_051962005.1 nucleoporin p54-like [Xyrauchen texanus]XP_051962006.1 nucleoporin p54-like [Xyrauchen texanus]XP_051962007.1 nucleoporin p54-like [Xyrauchen texanus]
MAFNFGGASGTASTPGFSFKTPSSNSFGFGASTTTTANNSTGFGLSGTGFGATTTTAPSTGFGFGSSTTGAFGGFGSTSTSANAGTTFSFSTPSNTGGSLFGNTQNKGFGFSSGLGSSTAPGTGFGSSLGGTGMNFGGFGGIQPTQNQQGGLFNQQGSQSSQLINTASALSAPSVLGDERDSILAKWNQLQAFWGTGKGYFNSSTPPVEFSLENPFCRFKSVGYSCVPAVRDEDGLVALALNKKEVDVRSQQQQLVESLHKILGGNQTLTVNVEGVRALPDDQTEVIVYLVERSPNGTSKRVPASTLFNFMEQMNVKSQLQQLSVFMTVSRTSLTPAQLKQLLHNPPAGVDPIIWEQARVDNPDPDKLIPVPMVGFKELLRRLKIQDQMNKQHQTRVDIISNDISELQRNQATTAAKITQYKRKLMEQSHRVLQVLIKQEVQRKSGYAIQLDEEHLRVQLETIQSELNAPTQFKGRLNELMSQIRMQNHFGAVRSEERYRVDADLLREIKQHLKQQQEGLSHLISVIKDDVDDIKMIEDGLQDSIHTRSSKHS